VTPDDSRRIELRAIAAEAEAERLRSGEGGVIDLGTQIMIQRERIAKLERALLQMHHALMAATESSQWRPIVRETLQVINDALHDRPSIAGPTEVERLRSRVRELEDEAKSGLTKSVAELATAVDRMEVAREAVRAENDKYETELSEAEAEVERLRARVAEMEAEISEWQATGPNALKAIRLADKRIATLEAALRQALLLLRSLRTWGETAPYQGWIDELNRIRDKADGVIAAIDAALGGGGSESALPDLDLLRKLASGEGGRRTGDLIRRGWIRVEVTDAGRAALGEGET